MEQILFNAILSRIQKEILNNKEEIIKVNKIDMKYCKRKVDISKLCDIIQNYKNRKLKTNSEGMYIYCNGNPYVVLNLAMIAMCTRVSIKINIDETMIGVNTCVLKIINKILSDNDMNIIIEIVDEIKCNNVIFIDRINDYSILKMKCNNAKFIPYEALDVFYDDEMYKELFEKIYEYAINMNIDIDLFDEYEGIDSVFKYGNANKVLFLTDRVKEIKAKDDKKIYINENPFEENSIVFNDKLIMDIINED